MTRASDFVFGTVGAPRSTPLRPGGSVGAVRRLTELGLGAYELAWVQSVRVTPATCEAIRQEAAAHGLGLSIHAPYYINLNADRAEWPKARRRLMDAARYGHLAGATDIVFHPGSYFGAPPGPVLEVAIPRLEACLQELRRENNPVRLRPETMGKSAMLGSLEDSLEMARRIDGVEPCLDFAHLHARPGDGSVNSYAEWADALRRYREAARTGGTPSPARTSFRDRIRPEGRAETPAPAGVGFRSDAAPAGPGRRRLRRTDPVRKPHPGRRRPAHEGDLGTPLLRMSWAARQKALEQLHRRMRRCRRCLELGCHIVPPAVFTGRIGARVMVVGQAPGVREVEAGRPFHAQSGRRLFEWLSRAGFQEDSFRETQYMTSITKCFPGKAASGSGDRKPTADEVEACRPYLVRQLELVDPALVLAVGRMAIDFFFEDRPALETVIGSLRQVQGRVVVPLPHPSGASRWHQAPENRRRIDRAIRQIARQRRLLGV